MNLLKIDRKVVRHIFVMSAIMVLCTCLCIFDTSLATANQNSQKTDTTNHTVNYEKDIQPVLETYCYKCHSSKKRKGGLRLDLRDPAMQGGDSGPVIVPGKPDESEIIELITTDDEDFMMPPKGDRVPKEKIALIKTWIKQGAHWPKHIDANATNHVDHWAFVKPEQPPIPKVNTPTWVKNEIDAFVLAKLQANGLKPSPRADRIKLVRRLYLDLIGLPPTPAEADAFLNDKREDAYERLVDKLLASPQYGERWARRWLDLARYADTNGYEKDRVRSIWAYRDWVINALNKDIPFDQFTIEQIAGDMLPNATEQQKIATGFHRNTMINEEGGIDVEEFRYHAMVDRVGTTGTTWLGLTLACAQCHTHKYDPITQREYYQLFAFMNNADEPELPLTNPHIKNQRENIQSQINDLTSKLKSQFPTDSGKMTWHPIKPHTVKISSGIVAKVNNDGTVIVDSGKIPDKEKFEVLLHTKADTIQGIQLQALPMDHHTGPGRTAHGNFVVTELSIHAGTTQDTLKPVALISAEANVEQVNYEVAKAIDGNNRTGWGIDDGSGNLKKTAHANFTFSQSITAKDGLWIKVIINQQLGGGHTLAKFKLAVGSQKTNNTNESQQARFAKAFNQWLTHAKAKSTHWHVVVPKDLKSAGNATFTIKNDHSVLVSGDHPNFDTYEMYLTGDGKPITAIRLEVLPDKSLPMNGPGRAPLFSEGDFLLSEVSIDKIDTNGKSLPIPIAHGTESYTQAGRSAKQTFDNKTDTGWSIKGRTGEAHHVVYQLKQPVTLAKGEKLKLTLLQQYIHQMTIGRFRLSTTNDAGEIKSSGMPSEIEATVIKDSAKWTNAERADIEQYFLLTTPELKKFQAKINQLKKSLPRYQTTMVMTERPQTHPRKTFIHQRGEFLRAREEVTPNVPAVLHPYPENAKRDRLGFANWLMDKNNPLVARVMMNRHWEAFFGRGIVKTLEDFGVQGDQPTHPKLLDWLAVEFMNRAWSQKQMHKLIVMSATYQQSSKVTPELLEKDPENLLLARGARFRVEAELVRDLALRASGLLSDKIGGPSVFPPQPAGVTSLSYGAMAWQTSKGEDRYRRALYTFTKRTTPYAMLSLFDGGSGETCLAKRERSNTPLQALTLLNDMVFLECAQTLAKLCLDQNGLDDLKRMRLMFRRVLTREPQEVELTRLIDHLNRTRDRLNKGELNAKTLLNDQTTGDTKELAAWAEIGRVLFNLDEAITRE